MTLTFEERIDRLVPFTRYGPDYNRGVRENLSDACRSHDWDPEGFSAEYFMLRAECHAGFITEDEYHTAVAHAQGKLI